jgi:hypothetical protein
MITSVLDKSAGFYSILFFTINHYIYCKRNNISFTLDSSNWLFKSKEGWNDYFKPIDFVSGENNTENRTVKHNELLGNYDMWEYQRTIRNHLYLYNDEVLKRIAETKQAIGLVDGEYDAIFIRRGDKLCSETSFLETEKYINLLLRKNPECKTIFLQTDDYNCFLDLEKYIKDRELNIQVITLCHPDVRGMVVFDKALAVETDNCVIRDKKRNCEYFEKVFPDLKKFTPVDKMDSAEIYEHTIEMLIGVDIVLHSKFCILDNQSNVARFISIVHNDHMKLFDVRYPDENIQMHWTMCPAYW